MPRLVKHAPPSATESPPLPPARERILASAMALVQQQGMQALTQTRVAADAGLRQSHLTYYFPTRSDLLKAVVEKAHIEVMQAMTPPPDAALRPVPSLAEVRSFISARASEPLMPRLMLALIGAADEDPSLRSWLVELDEGVIQHMAGVFSVIGLAPADDELRLFHAAVVGAAILGTEQDTPASAARAAHLTGLAFDRLVAASPALNRRKRP